MEVKRICAAYDPIDFGVWFSRFFVVGTQVYELVGSPGRGFHL